MYVAFCLYIGTVAIVVSRAFCQFVLPNNICLLCGCMLGLSLGTLRSLTVKVRFRATDENNFILCS